MIQNYTYLDVADNSGAKSVRCFHVLGGTKRRYGSLGDIIVVSVREAIPKASVKKGDVMKAVIVRTKKGCRRDDGSHIKFDRNACVLVNAQGDPVGTRYLWAGCKGVAKEKYMKIISLAPEVI